MKILIYIIIIFSLLISCNNDNKDNNEELNNDQIGNIDIQTKKTATNKLYINPTTTNHSKIKNTKTDKTSGTELDPVPTSYEKIDSILNQNQYKIMIYEISELIAEKGINGILEESIQNPDSYEIIAYQNSTPLFLAVQYGYYDLADELIKEGADVNARVEDMETEDGLDMLYFAVKNNDTEMTKLLIDNDVYAGREYGYEYSYYLTDTAIKNNNLEILKLLIESGDLDTKTTLIPKAVDAQNIEMVEYLLSIGQNINEQIFSDGFWINSPMKVAAENGNIDIASFLIEKGANLNSSDDYIYNAVQYGNYDVVKLLVDNDIFNINTNTTIEQALTLARDKKYYEIEKLLYSENTEEIDGYDDIMNAVSKGDIEKLGTIIETNKDLNKQYDKITPLSLAAARNDTNMIRFLVQNGADINLEDGYGYSPIMKAVFYNNTNAITTIADLNADLNAVCSANGQTPLTYLASEYGTAKLCYHLIKKNADVNKQNKNGYTPLMTAAEYGFPSTLGIFVHAGADYNIRNNEGKTVYDIAEDNSPAILETLNNPQSLDFYLNN
ncbi:ankyrin repeat domain-containing protein [Brachyspira pulli]|uniref:ankyrin repeat domain-containing protein n=1 Tax=Brachyspira pulli TaxID=310721 RepID=UPI003005E555